MSIEGRSVEGRASRVAWFEVVGALLLPLLVGCAADEPANDRGSDGGDDAAEPSLTIDDSQRHQVLEGFGAAIAWHIDTLVEHPSKGAIYSLIFRELGLDILRFRNRFERSEEPYDLSQEREIFDAATASLGRRPQLLLTSWSPPAGLKNNGHEDCTGFTENAADCTLAKTPSGEFVYEAFADWWERSLDEYRDRGLEPDFVSIQNEPRFTGAWEGCRFQPTEESSAGESPKLPGYDRALEAVHAAFEARGGGPALLGPETLGVDGDRTQSYLDAAETSLLAGVAHHLYSMRDGTWDWRDPGPDSYVAGMQRVRVSAGELPVFVTEFNTDEDGFIEGGFETAWLIHNSLVRGGAVAWLYWDLVWSQSGLVSLTDPGGGEPYRVRDQYYSLRHYARFTDPGYQRVEVSVERTGLARASAFVSPEGDRLVVVLLNIAREGQPSLKLSLRLTEPSWSFAEGYRSVFRPGESSLWQPVEEPAPGVHRHLAPRSVETLVYER